MSEKVLSPFRNPEKGKMKTDSFISEIPQIVGAVKDTINVLKEKITPEMQEKKAGIWWEMLRTFVKNPSMNGNELAAQFEANLPFKQKSTKRRFMSNNIKGKSRENIINHLVTKINDELLKGGFPNMSKTEILAAIGVKKVSRTLAQTLAVKLGRAPIPTSPQSTITLPLADSQIKKGDPRYDVIRPLKSTLKISLRTKGVTPSENIEVLTNQFYNEIVRSDQPNNFTGQIELPSINLYDYSRNNADEATDAVITAVISYIKGLKDRKAQGGTLSRVQEIIVNGTEKAEYLAKEKAKETAAQKLGSEILFGGKWLYIIGGVFILIFGAIILRRK